MWCEVAQVSGWFVQAGDTARWIWTLYQPQKCIQIPLMASSDHNSARTPPTTRINTPLSRSPHCALNGGTTVKIARRIAEIYAQTWGQSKFELPTTKSSRSRAAEKLWSTFFFKSKAWFFPQNPCYTHATFTPLSSHHSNRPKRRRQLWVDRSRMDDLPNFERLPWSYFMFDFQKQHILV